MQQAVRRLNRNLLQLRLSFSFPPCPLSSFLSCRVFCCTQSPSSQPQNPSHVVVARSACHTQETDFRECSSQRDLCGNTSPARSENGSLESVFTQASSNPGYGKLNISGAHQDQKGSHTSSLEVRFSSLGSQEFDAHSLSYEQHAQTMVTLTHESSTPPCTVKRILHGLEILGDQVDPSTYSSLLQLYSNSKSVSNGKLVHAHIVSHGLEHDSRLEALLLDMYCKCDAMEDALVFFTNMQRPCHAPSWNVVMKTLNEQGEGERALLLYERMQLEGNLPDKVTYISLMSVCAALAKPYQGVIIHACNRCGDFSADIILETATLNMYAKSGRIIDARRLFDCMLDRNVVTWTTYITAHTQQNKQKETLQLFNQMHQEAQVPNRVTYVNTISACSALKDLANGKRIHVLMLCNEVDHDSIVISAFTNMYGNCASSKDALEVFFEFPECNLVTWNAVIVALVNCGQVKEAFNQFLQMQQYSILPDRVTFLGAIDACSKLGCEKHGNWVHACISGTGSTSHTTLNNALISMYARFGKLWAARQVFEEMSDKNVVSWNTIITAYAQGKQSKDACQLFHQMLHEGILADKVSLYGYFDVCGTQNHLAAGLRMHACLLGNESISVDAFLVTAIITMYGKCGSLKYAQETFDGFLDRIIINWNALLAAYAQQHAERRALLLFDQLLWEGMVPSEATFAGLLAAYENPAFLADGKRMHTIILSCGHATDVIVANALINMYSKCGSLMAAQIVFDEMFERDAVSWTTIIGAYGEHGQGTTALKFFNEMLKYRVPDEVTFLNVLTACNRSGLLEHGNRWFKAMSGDYGIAPNGEHYSCMIDFFGRAGRLEEAENLMEQMPLEPSYRAWVAFLGACRYTNDVKRAELAAQYLFENHPDNHQPLVLLANIYAAAGRREDAAQLRAMIRA